MGESYTKRLAVRKPTGDLVEILTCDTCGAAITEQTRTTHDRWHGARDTRSSRMDDVLKGAGLDPSDPRTADFLKKMGLDR